MDATCNQQDWGLAEDDPARILNLGLPGSSPTERNIYLEAYLSYIDEKHRDSEHAEMLRLITRARPSGPLTPLFVVERRVKTSVEPPVFDFDVPTCLLLPFLYS
jgi:hypothetical protein